MPLMQLRNWGDMTPYHSRENPHPRRLTRQFTPLNRALKYAA